MLKLPKFVSFRSAVALRRCASSSAAPTNEFTRAMRGLASPVAIITCKNTNTNEYAGMTVSSVCSVSIRPDPIISFNIHVPSRTSRILKANGGLCAVNILDPSNDSIQLANAFAGSKGQINPFEEYPALFREIDGHTALKSAGSVLLCRIRDLMSVQDHDLATATVLRVVEGTGSGVVYQHGEFHSVKPLDLKQ